MNGPVWRHGNGTDNERPHRGGWLLWCAAAALAGVALAACGSVHASGMDSGSGSAAASGPGSGSGPTSAAPGGTSAAGSSSQPALCRDAATVTSLEIERAHGGRVPELQPSMPNQVTVSDPAVVRAVARAVCGLPAMPRGVFNCPAQLLDSAYSLRFAVDRRPLPLVTIDTTGCEQVTGAGPVRHVTSEAFWQVLGRALGARVPVAFRGGVPGSPCPPPVMHVIMSYACPVVARPGAGLAVTSEAAAR